MSNNIQVTPLKTRRLFIALLAFACLFSTQVFANKTVTVNSTDAELSQLDAQESDHEHHYRIHIGDKIHIALPGEESLNQGFTVNKQGQIILQEVGVLDVAGLTRVQLQHKVMTALSRVFKDLNGAQVYLAQKQKLVFVLGYVHTPGEVLLPGDADIQMALKAAGGLRAGAQLDQLQLRKSGQAPKRFNYKRYLDSGESDLLPQLSSMDTLFVPASSKIGNIEMEFDPSKIAAGGDATDRLAIKVFGEVHSQGSFVFDEKSNLVEYLMKAGGVTRYAGVEQIRVIIDSKPVLFNLTRYLDSGDLHLLPKIAAGTTIFVPKKEEQINAGANMIYVMGEVFKPGAYQGQAEASFMDILANAGGPTRFAESRQIRIIKASGEVRPFDLSAYTEGSSREGLPHIQAGDAIFVPEKTDINEKSWLKVAPSRAVRVLGEVVRPGRVEWSDEMSFLDLLAHVGGPTSRADTSGIDIVSKDKQGTLQSYRFDLDSFIKQGRAEHELPTIVAGATIRVHDLPTDPTDNKSQWVRQASDKSIYVFGQVGAPGRYMFTDDMHFLDILAAADGPTDKADLRNIRISHRNKKTAKISKVNLALYFETGDEHLLPKVSTGDTIYLPEQNRHWLEKAKETTVRVLGSVNKPGRYAFDDNMTILDLLAQAGGTSDSAHIEKITVINLSCCRDQARIFDLSGFAKSADFSLLPVIRAGDTVYVPDEGESTLAKVRNGLENTFELVSLAALLGFL
ncbi:polysaccharide biosynthesis/export family protein [Thalassomonas actiniarum]|uniref:SLBB domain-containing protein n=1 Tax=Thalassomonas actiniarum TaxID=485447 RepID=A0AAF0C1J7_9GAMM|nr:SLBB domain-containing protein [Thalassomonas actiniarum]WDD96835.1 SLBB domain-containing protein [Thalassomonas actiniarum]